MSAEQDNAPISIPKDQDSIFYKGDNRPKRSATLGKIALALAKAQGEMINVEKDGSGNYGSYGTLAATWVSIRKPLADNEIAIYQRPMKIENKPTMCTMLLHSSGEFIDDSELEMIFDASGRMNAMQAMGSAVTYSRRYTLQAATGVAPADDDDGAGSGDPKKQNQNQQRPQDNAKTTEKKGASAPKFKPEDFPMPLGKEGVKGVPLKDLSSEVLNNILAWTIGELAKDQTKQLKASYAQIESNIRAVLKGRETPTEKPKDDIPENVDKKTGEVFPPDDPQFSPDTENQSQERGAKKVDPGSYVIPIDFDNVEVTVKGKALKSIDEASLRAISRACDHQLMATPQETGTSMTVLFEIKTKIFEFFKSMGLSV